jgi:hypothetical protein
MLHIAKFGCYNLHLPVIFDAKPCMKINHLEFNLSECFEQCPFECKTSSYDLSVSYTDYPSYNYYKTLMEKPQNHDSYAFIFQTLVANVTYEMFKESLVRIFIYFDEIKTTEITESPSMTLVDLVANIGGTLGLFIGVSLLSFVEIIELLMEVIRILSQGLIHKN